jgi:hypothetical protein
MRHSRNFGLRPLPSRGLPNSDGFGRPFFFQCLIDGLAAIVALALIIAILGSVPMLFILALLLVS